MAGTSLNGMMRARKTEMSSICVITASNRMKPRNAFSTSTPFAVMNGTLLMFTSWMGSRTAAGGCGWFFKTKGMGSLGFSPAGN
jgi:hypothetical protein